MYESSKTQAMWKSLKANPDTEKKKKKRFIIKSLFFTERNKQNLYAFLPTSQMN